MRKPKSHRGTVLDAVFHTDHKKSETFWLGNPLTWRNMMKRLAQELSLEGQPDAFAGSVMNSSSDLVARTRQGEQDAFRLIFERYSRPVLSFIYDMVGNREAAEDLTQETFVRLNGLKEVALKLLSAVESLRGGQAPPESKELKLDDEVRRFESRLIKEALAKTGGNQARAARLLGVKHTTLNAKIKRYQISVDGGEVTGGD